MTSQAPSPSSNLISALYLCLSLVLPPLISASICGETGTEIPSNRASANSTLSTVSVWLEATRKTGEAGGWLDGLLACHCFAVRFDTAMQQDCAAKHTKPLKIKRFVWYGLELEERVLARKCS